MENKFIRNILFPLLVQTAKGHGVAFSYEDNAKNFDEVLIVSSQLDMVAKLEFAADEEGFLLVFLGEVTHIDFNYLKGNRGELLDEIVRIFVGVLEGKVTEQIWWWNTKCVRYKTFIAAGDIQDAYYDMDLLRYLLFLKRWKIEIKKYAPYPMGEISIINKIAK